MNKSRFFSWALVIAVIGLMGMGNTGCEQNEPVSSSGVRKATAQVQTDQNGQTIEQKNIMARLAEDNKPGAIKHLYVISPMSGQVILYSTVKGKVTSGQKRLTPKTLQHTGETVRGWGSMLVNIGGTDYTTGEVIQDDGTYGDSSEYIYWWDAQGRYHQHLRGMCEIHISDQPLKVSSVTLNVSPAE